VQNGLNKAGHNTSLGNAMNASIGTDDSGA
jgi:hypothetical protein